ncbi:MAG: 2-phosphosulfolactate phosphatase [Limnochordia bacterium]|nr:2-phosphosulfolactate phosphatase [Limnochordia bacterium]NLO96096.1 2-phosphosulfolactate phosphatase [Bacillota bacterium]HOB39990.1 2-phosphosulfolactate phosphatase [Limnochordia bacterium]HOK30951.1 2-phosphosulfolactate phosphatase [Limnochordia bacterium]HOL99973.1 2-phosphosulfolactate phosphatase [Limnochordia bacterium]
MRVDVILSPEEVVHHDLAGRVGVVIDVFRFTTTVLAALEAGIERFYPVGEVEEAWRLKASHPKLLLAGERNALKIPGFDFGNSPLEHHGRRYQGGELVFTTTNGTRAVRAAREAALVVLACLRSAPAAAAYLADLGQDVVLIPAGLEGRFSLEDTWCAGLIASLLPGAEYGDGAKAALALWAHLPREDLAQSAHGRRLQALGFSADLSYCLECGVSTGVVLWDPETGWGALGEEG